MDPKLRTTRSPARALALLGVALALPSAARAEAKSAIIFYPSWGAYSEREQDNVRGSLQSAVAAQGYEVVEDRLLSITLSGDPRLQGCMETTFCRVDLADRVNARVALGMTQRTTSKSDREVELTLYTADTRQIGATIKGTVTARFLPEPNPDLVSLVGELFAAERKRGRATLVARSEPPGADVLLDGDLVGTTELRRAIYSGDHKLKVQSGARFQELELTAQPEKIHEVTVDFAKGTADQKLVEPVTGENPRGYLKWVGVAGIAAGVAAIGAGIAMLALNGRGTCGADRCPQVYDTLGAGVGLTVAGGLLAAAGGVLVYLGVRQPMSKTAAVTLIPSLSPSAAGLTVIGRF